MTSRQELAKQINDKATFENKSNRIVVLMVETTPTMTIVHAMKNGKQREFWIGELLDILQEKNMVAMTANCTKCNGTGFVKHYAHVNQGRCWTCEGDGRKSSAIHKRAMNKYKTPQRITDADEKLKAKNPTSLYYWE